MVARKKIQPQGPTATPRLLNLDGTPFVFHSREHTSSLALKYLDVLGQLYKRGWVPESMYPRSYGDGSRTDIATLLCAKAPDGKGAAFLTLILGTDKVSFIHETSTGKWALTGADGVSAFLVSLGVSH